MIMSLAPVLLPQGVSRIEPLHPTSETPEQTSRILSAGLQPGGPSSAEVVMSHEQQHSCMQPVPLPASCCHPTLHV